MRYLGENDIKILINLHARRGSSALDEEEVVTAALSAPAVDQETDNACDRQN